MGGSGGSSIGPISDVEALRRELRAEIERQERDLEVNEYLAQQLASFNNRDIQGTRERLEEIEQALGADALDVERLLFGGSVAKHTYVDGLSDVDALVVVDSPDAVPDTLVERLAHALRARLPQAEVADVSSGNLAVTVTYRDGTQVQILPAVERDGRTSIASEDGRSWRQIRPHKFAEKLTQVNQQNGQRVVPTVKLAKALVSALPREEQISGYHMEAIAVDAFRSYEGRRDRASMLKHLISHSARAVLRPTVDITGQNLHIDDHLGERGSAQRQVISASLGRLVRQMDAAQDAEAYRRMFGE